MQNKAFTLVELMVVIAIIAILAVGSMRGYSSYLRKAQLSNALQFAARIDKSMPTKGSKLALHTKIQSNKISTNGKRSRYLKM